MGDAVVQPPIIISLRRLFPQASFVGCADLRATHVSADSRTCRPKSLFAVIRGHQLNGREFIRDALSRGAAGLIVDRPIPDIPVPQCVVQDVRCICGDLRFPLRSAIATAQGRRRHRDQRQDHSDLAGPLDPGIPPGALRSPRNRGIQRRLDDRAVVADNPGPEIQAAWLARMVRRGAGFAAIEVSSHALDQRRISGTELQCGAITNITRDHFDYHGTFEAYQTAKARLLESIRPGGLVVLNRDDPGAWALRERVDPSRNLIATSLGISADVTAQLREESLRGTAFQLAIHGRTVECHTTLIGRHNVANCLTAAAILSGFGLSPEQIAAGLDQFRVVPGRLERIACGQPFDAFVDYAHTDDALARCLQALRSMTPGRLIVVFGAGGDRDRDKRPLMGRAALHADVQIVTSDNPRSEVPERIIEEILAGMAGARPIVEIDRAVAIRRALELAAPGDCVLVAGKGHELEQIIGAERLPFDDRQVVRQWLSRLMIERNLSLPKFTPRSFARVG